MDGGLQSIWLFCLLVDVKNGVGTRSTVTPCSLERPGVNEEDCTNPVADRVVGVTIDDAVGLREHCPGTFLYGVTGAPGSVEQTDAIAAEGDQLAVRQMLPASHIAHVAVHCIHFFAGEGVENGNVGEVSGMEDDVASGKGRLHLGAKGI